MSLYNYKKSQEIAREDPLFAALIMSAMRKADSRSIIKLGVAFPRIFSEFQARNRAPLGMLDGDKVQVKIEDSKGKVETFQKIFKSRDDKFKLLR